MKPVCCPECGTSPVSYAGRVVQAWTQHLSGRYTKVTRTVWACNNQKCGLEWVVCDGHVQVVARAGKQD